ncbi:hypothetical protein AVEN_255908-1 [Araneus ventricosus]|uniref:Uncharacterized protein n=1 Tax=Araneus ventricosus TaxID=182803 RepID=A0A4Y2PAZ4_ARAVE|nr:hypothetical protein AVEN_255908-1 [Araneus ventricosus]
MKCDQSPCQSWFKHIGIEKSNNYTVQFFSAHRNTKTSSKLDESTDLSTTDQGNGQDTGLEEGELAEDADPDLHPLRSDWNELCLVYCDKCDYLYAHQAFMRHQEVRHSQQQDPYLYQHRLYKKKPEPTPAQERKERRKAKNGNKSTTDKLNIKQVRTDDSKNNDSESNVVNKTDVKSGPGPGKSRKKRKRQFGTKRKKQRIVLENCEETSLQIVTENSIEGKNHLY